MPSFKVNQTPPVTKLGQHTYISHERLSFRNRTKRPVDKHKQVYFFKIWQEGWVDFNDFPTVIGSRVLCTHQRKNKMFDVANNDCDQLASNDDDPQAYRTFFSSWSEPPTQQDLFLATINYGGLKWNWTIIVWKLESEDKARCAAQAQNRAHRGTVRAISRMSTVIRREILVSSEVSWRPLEYGIN